MGLRKLKSIKHNGKTLAQILEAHERYWAGKAGGARADLTGADLSRADLSGTNLAGAILRNSFLRLPTLNLVKKFSEARIRGTQPSDPRIALLDEAEERHVG